jgi:hypothetical protein
MWTAIDGRETGKKQVSAADEKRVCTPESILTNLHRIIKFKRKPI